MTNRGSEEGKEKSVETVMVDSVHEAGESITWQIIDPEPVFRARGNSKERGRNKFDW